MKQSNNFDLIRLAAAMQVAMVHSLSHLEITNKGAQTVLRLMDVIPGVPVFFFVSGYLISLSYEHNSSLKEYAVNRMLRIYPALIVCTAASLLSVYLSGYFSRVDVALPSLLVWVLSQISIAQFYNPDFMRSYGVGVLNGSLWTISVEIQFYIAIPLLYRYVVSNRLNKNDALLCLVNRPEFAGDSQS